MSAGVQLVLIWAVFLVGIAVWIGRRRRDRFERVAQDQYRRRSKQQGFRR